MKIEVNKSIVGSLLNIASIVEARDTYTGGHLWRVSQFSKLIARKLGLSENEVTVASLGGFLHDLGKLGMPDSILLKPSSLTKKEREVMKTHPGIGYQLVQSHPLCELVQDPIYQHHEQWNGKGYPNNLHEDEVSVYARIVGIADAFDAMTSQRIYRKGMTIEKSLSIIESERNEQFEGKLVDCMLELNKTNALEHIVGHSDEGILLVDCHDCGPIIVVERDTKDGDYVFCHGCSGKFQLHQKGDIFEAIFVDEFGDAEQMKPRADNNVISDMVRQLPVNFQN